MDISNYQGLALTRAGRILTVTLNRPEQMNAADMRSEEHTSELQSQR